MKKLILFFAVMFLTGCASMNPSPEVMQTKALRVQAQHQLASKPFLVLNCVSGCSAVMHDPRAATYIDRVEAKGAADVAIKALGVADSVISKGVIGYAGASIAKAIVKNAGEKNFNAGGDINNDTPSTTISNSSIDGTQDNSVVTTTRPAITPSRSVNNKSFRHPETMPPIPARIAATMTGPAMLPRRVLRGELAGAFSACTSS